MVSGKPSTLPRKNRINLWGAKLPPNPNSVGIERAEEKIIRQTAGNHVDRL
jgi:hypothetical protein